MTSTHTYTLNTINKCPYTALISNEAVSTHIHEFWEITYVTKGNLTHVINGTHIDCKPFLQFIIIRPNDTHRIVASEKKDVIIDLHRDIYVPAEKMKNICDLLNKSLYEELLNKNTPICVSVGNGFLECLEPTLNLFSNLSLQITTSTLEFDAIHTSIVSCLLGKYLENQLQTTKQLPEWLEDFFKKLSTEEFLTKSTAEIINELVYSHSYICRTFKKYIGKTMMQCINEAKIHYAAVLLMENNLSITDIAYRLNYQSQSAFITKFKKIYHLPPNQWKKLNLNQKRNVIQEQWGDIY